MDSVPRSLEGLLLRPQLSISRIARIMDVVSHDYADSNPAAYPTGESPIKEYCRQLNERFGKKIFGGGAVLRVSNKTTYEEQLTMDLQQLLFLREEGPDKERRGTVPGWLGEGMAQGIWERMVFEHLRDRDYAGLFRAIAAYPWQKHGMEYHPIQATAPDEEISASYAVMRRTQPDTLSAHVRTTEFSDRNVVASVMDDWRRTEEYVWH